ncbi:MAG TPA: hypothetical protein VF395_09200 [Polyangiaceae bacterium]
MTKNAARIIASKRKEIAALDDEFFGEVVGVAQAIGELRKALNQLSASLDGREFEQASALGYGAVAVEFIFLQRTLGGLQGACLSKEKLVSDIAYELRCPYEEVLPQVDAVMQSPHPLSDKQRKENRKALPQFRARLKAMTQKRKQNR